MFNKIKNFYHEYGLVDTIKWLMKKTINKIRLKINIYKSTHSKLGNNKEKIKNRSGKRLFMFAGVPLFDIGGGQRSAQLSKYFNDLGYDIFYIYALPTSESKIHKMNYPTVLHKYVNRFKEGEFKKLISKEDLVIFEMPSKKYIPFLNIAYETNTNIIYESIDNWETLGSNFFDKNTLKEFLKKSTLLTATAKELKIQLHKYMKEFDIKEKDILYSPNAVNDKLFNPNIKYEKPKDIFIGEKTFTYYGTLWGSWFNWKLIENLANINPKYQINIIGDEKTIPDIIEKMPLNVHFLGIKKQTELPNYLKYTDYSILPFKKDNITEYVSPLKIFEYISMNTRVLTTTLPDIKDYPNTYYGDTIEEWKKVIDENPRVNIKEAEEFIKKNNWDYRCKEILKKF